LKTMTLREIRVTDELTLMCRVPSGPTGSVATERNDGRRNGRP
jgi:hypothetical protein